MDDGWTIVECGNCSGAVREVELSAWGQCSVCEDVEWEAANSRWASDEEVDKARKDLTERLYKDALHREAKAKAATENSEAALEPTREEIAAAFGVEPQDVPGAPPEVRDKLASLIQEYYDADGKWLVDEILSRFDVKEKA